MVQVPHVYGTKQDIAKVVRSVYVNQVTWQLTKIVGALDLVGNPISLMASVGTGVKDFFYEPSQGLIQSPMAFGRGVAKGTLSLMSHTTSGALSAVGRITKTVKVVRGVREMPQMAQIAPSSSFR